MIEAGGGGVLLIVPISLVEGFGAGGIRGLATRVDPDDSVSGRAHHGDPVHVELGDPVG